MSQQAKSFRRAIFAAAPIVALCGLTAAQANETTPAINENINKNPVFDGTQTIRNMVKTIGPEAVMDMMFSSIDPVCQKTLLSKATEPSKAPASIEDMRDNQYFQPAIVVGNQAAQWTKTTPDGRSVQPLFNWMDSKNYWGWVRMNKPSGEAAQKATPAALPPKRY